MASGHDFGGLVGEVQRRLAGHIGDDEDTDKGFPSAKKEGRAAVLRDIKRLYDTTHEFKPGDWVEWKPGLRGGKWPNYGEPAIVMEVLTREEFERIACTHLAASFKDPAATGFRNYDTLAVGILIQHGDIEVFETVHVDPHRMMPAKLDRGIIGD